VHGGRKQRAAGGGGSLVGAPGSSPASGAFSGWDGPQLDTASPAALVGACGGSTSTDLLVTEQPPGRTPLHGSCRGRCCSDACGRR
jgi:hypothetical protein